MKVCLFDIDGTLIRSGGAGKLAFLRTLEQAFQIEVGEPGVPFAGRTDRGIISDLFSHYGMVLSDESWNRFAEVYFDVLPICLNECKGRVLPGVESMLRQLGAAENMGVGLLTGNMVKGAEIKLRYFDLFDYFDFGGFGDQFVDRDRVAEEALATTRSYCNEQIKPENIFVIGDTPNDVRCGQSIGARTVAVCTGNYSAAELSEVSPDFVFEDLSLAQPLIERLCARHQNIESK